MAEPLKVGLAGLGTVGTAVVHLLEHGRDKLTARCGRPIEVVAVSARSRNKKRDIDLKKFRWVTDPAQLAADPAIDVLVEVIGGVVVHPELLHDALRAEISSRGERDDLLEDERPERVGEGGRGGLGG